MSTRTIPVPRSEGQRRALPLWGIVVFEVLILCIPGEWWGFVGLSFLALLVLSGTFLSVLVGRTENLILGWVLVFPLGYYFLTYPHESTLISFDRVMVPLILLAGAFASPGTEWRVPVPMQRVGQTWAIFLGTALISLVHLSNPLGGTKLWLDAFVLPALLGLAVIRSFDVRRFIHPLHLMMCLFLIYSVAIGIAEVVLNRDLLPLPASIFFGVGETSALVPRVNGPFATNNSYALIGLIAFFLLLFFRRQMPEQIAFWRSVLHWVGVTAAFTMAVMSLFRSVLLTIVAAVALDTFFIKGFRRRALRISLLTLLLLGVVAFRFFLPEAYENRSDPLNFYGRVAQQVQTLEIFLSHPVTGIGLGNYLAFAPEFGKTADFRGVLSVDAPHNNLGQVFAETGVLGGIPYFTAQVLLVMAFWKVRIRNRANSRGVWACFLYIFLTYWVTGVSLSSGYYSDLNLWFIFAAAVLYKFAISENNISTSQLQPS